MDVLAAFAGALHKKATQHGSAAARLMCVWVVVCSIPILAGAPRQSPLLGRGEATQRLGRGVPSGDLGRDGRREMWRCGRRKDRKRSNPILRCENKVTPK